MTIDDLVIKPEFENLIPKLTEEENKQLEENILADGRVKEPITVWGNIIVDGHHRYYILKKHPEIPYTIEQMEFANEYAAMAWACANQLGRRNLSDKDKPYLIGKKYQYDELSHGSNQYKRKGGEPLENTLADKSGVSKVDTPNAREGRTVNKVAREFGIGNGTVQRDDYFAQGVDIAEEIIPGLKEEILHGGINVPQSTVQKISRATPDIQRKAVIAISKNDAASARKILSGKEEPEPEPYNIDDMVEEIKAAASELHFALNQTLVVMHPDVLTDDECRNRARERLQEIVTDVQEFITKIS